MLPLLSEGFVWSSKTHNCKNEIVCDWILVNVLLCEDDVFSKADFVDYLVEEHVYSTESMCLEYLDLIWGELESQLWGLGEYSPIKFEGRRARRVKEWNETPAFTFCLLLYLKKYFPDWDKHIKDKNEYGIQGRLFEELCLVSAKCRFTGFKVGDFGWSKSTTISFKELVEKLADFACEEMEPEEKFKKYVSKSAKDGGLDIAWTTDFPDLRSGRNTVLAQCASGHDLKSKLDTPNLSLWTKVIDWSKRPTKAFWTPFHLQESSFSSMSLMSQAEMFDRSRILGVNLDEQDWVPDELRTELEKWLGRKVDWIKSLDVA